jgi:hypothetical protein
MIRRVLVSLALAGVVLSGCSLGPRETWAESMRTANETAAKVGGAHVHMSVQLKVIETTIREVPDPLFSSLDGIVDFKNRTAKLAVKRVGAKSSTAYFRDVLIALPRSASAIATSHAGKHWSRFDFRRKPKPDIDGNDRYVSLGFAITPSLATDLLQGVLAGSIKQMGRETIGGTSTTKYFTRLAPDAAVRELRNERRREGILRMFETIGVKQDIFPVYVWMDEQGFARRIRYVLQQETDLVNKFRTTVQYDFSRFAAVPAIRLPERSDSVQRRRFLDFVTDYVRETG